MLCTLSKISGPKQHMLVLSCTLSLANTDLFSRFLQRVIDMPNAFPIWAIIEIGFLHVDDIRYGRTITGK